MTSSPLWRGGGRIFPNMPDENFSHKINKKMYRAGMASILSQLAREGRLAVVDSLTVDSPKTKPLAAKFKAMNLQSVLVIADEVDENLYLASRNLVNILVVEPRYADPVSLVHYRKVLVTKAAMDKLNEEAADGRYLRRKAYSLLWDGQSNELLVGTTSVSVLDRLTQLFEQTFGQKIEALSSGILAHKLAEPRGQSRAVDDAQHSTFLKGGAGNSPQWVVDDNSRDFLGNEFLVWLWNLQDEGHDTIKLDDGSEVAFMLARTLALECPKGQSGKESISSG
jgi:hypothetical protein